MKKSKYIYFFDLPDNLLGYSWLSDKYILFKKNEKDNVNRILNSPDDIFTQEDRDIYKTLIDKKFLVPFYFNEFYFLINKRNQHIHREDILNLFILPTMSCNLNCSYCYEAHPKLSSSKISNSVIASIKNLINNKLDTLKLLQISWFGGEPLMLPNHVINLSNFFQDRCKEKNVKFINQMTTNGVLLNKKIIKELSNVGIHFLQITIDGFKEWHDQVRVNKVKKPTFKTIIENIECYINENRDNKVLLRIHIPDNINEKYINKTLEVLSEIKEEIREQISISFQPVFDSCIDNWSNSQSNKIVATTLKDYHSSKKISIDYGYLYDEVKSYGYSFPQKRNFRDLVGCYAELNWSWAIRPDGYLNKCTVSIEKEHSQAKLTKTGITYFSEKKFDYKIKDIEALLQIKCKDCNYLPLCWMKCPKHILDQYLNNNLNLNQCKVPFGIETMLEEIKNRYFNELTNSFYEN